MRKATCQHKRCIVLRAGSHNSVHNPGPPAPCGTVCRAGLNRAQLAQKLGWKPSRVSKILTGSSNLTLKTIFQICQAIDLEFDVVLRKAAPAVKPEPEKESVPLCTVYGEDSTPISGSVTPS